MQICHFVVDDGKSGVCLCFLISLQAKEAALNLSIDAFCRLVKHHANVAQLVTM